LTTIGVQPGVFITGIKEASGSALGRATEPVRQKKGRREGSKYFSLKLGFKLYQAIKCRGVNQERRTSFIARRGGRTASDVVQRIFQRREKNLPGAGKRKSRRG